MNILKITQSNKVFIVEFNGQTLYVLNKKALTYHLRYQAKLDKTAVACISNVLEFQPTVEVDLAKVG